MGSIAKDPQPPRSPRRPGTQCTVAALIDVLDGDDTAVVVGWLNGEYPARAVSLKLAEHDHHVSRGAVERHRRRDCFCRLDRPELYG